jgi:hypothetical protein
MDPAWSPQVCPVCGKIAVAHGWIFEEPRPKLPVPDERQFVQEVFQHDTSDDCLISRRAQLLL